VSIVSGQATSAAFYYASVAIKPDELGNEQIRQEVETMCELVTGLLEHAALQKVNLPSTYWEQCWKQFTKERYRLSPALRAFWQQNRHWYAKEFRDIVDSELKQLD
jgi:hypothetical protein